MNLLVTGAWNHAQDHLEQIRQMGHDVRFLQYEKDDLPCTYDWVEGVICNGLFCHHSIEKFTRLRYIQLTSAGYDRVPMAYIREKGISVFNARGVYSIPMAEWADMSILEIYKDAYGFYRKQQQKTWEKGRSLLELAGKRAAIIGYGSVGRETAKRLAVFDVEITAVNRSRIEDDRIRNWIPLNRIDQALKQADIVILCIALTEETRNLLNADRLHGMKQGSVLVNMARGALLDEKELVGCLKEGRLRGAALDVFEHEPLLAESELWETPGVIISPHNSFAGDGAGERMAEVIRENLKHIKE